MDLVWDSWAALTGPARNRTSRKSSRSSERKKKTDVFFIFQRKEKTRDQTQNATCEELLSRPGGEEKRKKEVVMGDACCGRDGKVDGTGGLGGEGGRFEGGRQIQLGTF